MEFQGFFPNTAIDIWFTFLAFQQCFSKNLLLKASDNCLENTSAGTSVWIKIGVSYRPATTFIKKDTFAQVFLWECWEKFVRTPSSNKRMKHLAWKIRSRRSQIFFKIRIFQNHTIFTEGLLLESLFNKIAYLKVHNLIKKGDSNTGVFLWILGNF